MAVGATSAFSPTGTVALSATTASSWGLLAGWGASVDVTNSADAVAFVRFGSDLSISAGNADMPVLPHSRVMLSINNVITHDAAVVQTGDGVIDLTRGDGGCH